MTRHGAPVVPPSPDANSRIAILCANLLTLAAVVCGSLGLWRIGADLAWAGVFVVQTGLLSHWQVWIGLAAAMQYTSLRLIRHPDSAGSAIPVSAEPLLPRRLFR